MYRTDLEGAPPLLAPGSLVTVVDGRGLPLGTALYSTASTLAARLVSRTAALTREQYLADVVQRVEQALELRRTLAPESATNNACRLIFSEADNLPGIVADRYNDLVILQLLIQGTAQPDVRAAVIAGMRSALAAGLPQLTIWERTDPRMRELEQLPAAPSEALFSTVERAPRLPLSLRSMACTSTMTPPRARRRVRFWISA